MALLAAIAARLLAAGVATPGTDLFIGYLPAAPDTCLALYLRGGAGPVRAMGAVGSAPVADLPTVQVLARGASTPALDTVTAAVVAALDHWWGTVSGVTVQYSDLSYAPVDVGVDENRRPMRSIVFRMMVTR